MEKTQVIIYRKNGVELSRLSPFPREMPPGLVDYLRYYQPFTQEGDSLTIPCGTGLLRTSIIVSTNRKGNILIFQTVNSRYEVEYKNIDLERIIQDRKFEGVNEGSAHDFPYPN